MRIREEFVRFPACPTRENHYVRASVGLWRSLVARPSGGRKVAGSSPASPTNITAAAAVQIMGPQLDLTDPTGVGQTQKTARPLLGWAFLYMGPNAPQGEPQ